MLIRKTTTCVRRLFLFTGLLTATLLLQANQTQAAVLYNETFETSTFGTTGNWRARYSSTATLSTGPYQGNITSGAFGPLAPATSRYLYVQHQPADAASSRPAADTTHDWFLYSPNYMPTGSSAFSPKTYQGGQLQAQWAVNSSNANVTYYFAVQVNGNWYASTDSRTTNGSNQNLVNPLNLLTTNWLGINFNTASPNALSIGTTSQTFDQLFGTNAQITGLGFYIDDMPGSPSGEFRTVRFDNLSVTGELVPEPSRMLLLALGALVCFGGRRRSQSSSER